MDIKEDSSEEEKYVNLVLEIQRFLNDIGKPRISTISHYAPIEAAKKITENFMCLAGGAIYKHTESNLFEDKTEGKYVDLVYQDALKKIFDNKKIDAKKYDFLLNIKCDDEFFIFVDEKPNVTYASKNKCKYYICCFSENSDDANMWKTYLKGSHEGCSISHYLIDLEEQANQYFGLNYYHFIRKILYGYDEQLNYTCNFLEKILSFKSISDQFISFYVKRFLNMSRFSFKKEKYRNEKEIRSIITISESDIGKIVNDRIIESNEKFLLYKCNFGFPIEKITLYKDNLSTFNLDSFAEDGHIKNICHKSKFST